MNMVEIIDRKRQGLALSEDELTYCIQGFTGGEIPDYQMSALLMAICLKGMTMDETVVMTRLMMESGETLDLSSLGEFSMDKHSTGGVGDKTTLIVTPIVAAAGGKIAKMSGRGLGFTGGTADKLEAIPGYNLGIPLADFLNQVKKIGCGVVTQSGDLAPADKKIYALRDVTATTASIPLIAASIMSKKLAAGAKNIVLDVKVGNGAFMKTKEEALELARTMIAIGKAYDRKVTAVLTEMNQPLGCAVGNILEVEESMDVLKGQGSNDVREVSLVLSAHLLAMGLGIPLEKARTLAEEQINNGKALQVFEGWISAQGGRFKNLPKATVCQTMYSGQEGIVQTVDALCVGKAANLLGAGRAKKGDAIDFTAGVEVLVKQGEFCQKGQPMFVLHTGNEPLIQEAKAVLAGAVTLSSSPIEPNPLILDVVTG